MDYELLRDRAESRIAKYGQDAIFLGSRSEYDPITGKMGVESEEFSCAGVLTHPSEAEIASGSVQYGDAVLLVAARQVKQTPAIGSLIRFGARELRIVSIDEVAPDGEPILFKFAVRRA